MSSKEKNNLKYVFRTFRGVPFRFRIWLANKVMPKKLSQFGRAWAMGIEVSLEPAPKANRAQRRQQITKQIRRGIK